MSLGAQKEHKAESKRKSEIQLKIKRAEKNLKSVFTVFKKILDKSEEELVTPDNAATVSYANFAEKEGKYISYLFYVYRTIGGNFNSSEHQYVTSDRLMIDEFNNFLSFYLKGEKVPLTESHQIDIFMNLTKKFAALLVGSKPSDDTSPNRDLGDTLG